MQHIQKIAVTSVINRPGEAGAVLQKPLLSINSLAGPFPPYHQNIITPKL